MKKTKLIAIFLITLIITLPLYTGVAFGSFEVTSISGAQGIKQDATNGYRENIDVTTVNIKADYGTVRLMGKPNVIIPCTNNSNIFECLYLDTSIRSTTTTYKFYQLVNGRQIGLAQGIVKIDSAPPQFYGFQFSQPSKQGKNYSVQFSVTEKGGTTLSPTDTGYTGLKTITFYANDIAQGTYNFTPAVGSNNQISGTYSYTSLTDGETILYAEAEDFFGNKVQSAKLNLTVDNTGPVFDSIQAVRGGVPLKYISRAQLNKVYIRFKTTDDMLTGQVIGDLSGLSPGNKGVADSQKNVLFRCSKNETDYDCESSTPASLLILEGSSAIIKVKAKDSSGNEAEQELTLSFSVDSDSPTADKIMTLNCDSTKCYVKPGMNTLYVNIAESGAGFNHRFVYFTSDNLSLDIIPPGGQVQDCELIDSSWVCLKNITVLTSCPGSKHNVRILSPFSQDDVGNILAPSSVDLYFDDTAPSIESTKIFKLGQPREDIAEFDEIEIKMNIYDNVSGPNPEKTFADLSEVISGKTWVAANDCSQNIKKPAGNYICTWTPGSTVNSPGRTITIPFNVSDYAGNINYTTKDLDLYKRVEENVTFWSVKEQGVSTDPAVLDRLSSQYVPGKLVVWATVDLHAQPAVKQLYTQLKAETCVGLNESATYYKAARLHTTAPSTQELSTGSAVISLELDKSKALGDNISTLRFKCDLIITSAIGFEVYPSETVAVEIPVTIDSVGYNLPQDYSTRLKAFKKDLKSSDWIGSVKKYMDLGTKICTVLSVVSKILSIVDICLNGTWTVLQDMVITSGAAQVVAVGDKSINFANDLLTSQIGSWICGFFNCTLLDKILGGTSWSKDGASKYILAAIKIYVKSLTSSGVQDPAVWGTMTGGKSEVKASDGSTSSVAYIDQLEFGSTLEASKNSILISALTLCIPGIIYNLNKARQIDCMYVDCAERWTQNGLNPSTCDQMRSESYCNFVYGQIFHLIPFSGILELVGSMLKLFTSSPWMALGMVWAAACFVIPEASTYAVCAWPKKILNFVTFFTGLINDVTSLFGSDPADYCQRINYDD